jgi:predicted nucleotidyltransferase
VETAVKISEKFNKYLEEKIPERFHGRIKSAYSMLKNEGCTNVYLFGSLVKEKSYEGSDIDIGIRGLPDEKFFKVYAMLDHISDIEIDLVDFDDENDFFCMLKDIGRVKEIE